MSIHYTVAYVEVEDTIKATGKKRPFAYCNILKNNWEGEAEHIGSTRKVWTSGPNSTSKRYIVGEALRYIVRIHEGTLADFSVSFKG